jgi:hypothetical protein
MWVKIFQIRFTNIYVFFYEEIRESEGMENLHTIRGSVVRPPARNLEEEVIPESFPTWKAFLKTVGWGVTITLAEYGFLILLIARHR